MMPHVGWLGKLKCTVFVISDSAWEVILSYFKAWLLSSVGVLGPSLRSQHLWLGIQWYRRHTASFPRCGSLLRSIGKALETLWTWCWTLHWKPSPSTATSIGKKTPFHLGSHLQATSAHTDVECLCAWKHRPWNRQYGPEITPANKAAAGSCQWSENVFKWD
jgi:hypothetical protein